MEVIKNSKYYDLLTDLIAILDKLKQDSLL